MRTNYSTLVKRQRQPLSCPLTGHHNVKFRGKRHPGILGRAPVKRNAKRELTHDRNNKPKVYAGSEKPERRAATKPKHRAENTKRTVQNVQLSVATYEPRPLRGVYPYVPPTQCQRL